MTSTAATGVPDAMRALVMREFGSSSALQLTETQPVPRANTPHATPPALSPVLVRVEWAALNPLDAFMLSGKTRMFGMPKKLPHVLGCDFAGTVAELPHGAAADSHQAFDLKVGDRVFGSVSEFHHYPAPGTLAQYTSAPAHVLAKVPDRVDLAAAATVGTCGMTAALGVWKHLGLSKEHSAENANTSVLVYGAATCVGHYAAQLAKQSGYRVVGIASRRHHAYLTDTLGVDACVDYHDSDYMQQLAADPLNKSLAFALDAVGSMGASAGGSSVCQKCFDVLRACGSSQVKVASVNPFTLEWPILMLKHGSQVAGISELTSKCPDHPKGALSRFWATLGRFIGGGGGSATECANASLMQELGRRLAAGALVCCRVRKLEGLEAGGKEGLQLLANGELSGEKAVVHVTH